MRASVMVLCLLVMLFIGIGTSSAQEVITATATDADQGTGAEGLVALSALIVPLVQLAKAFFARQGWDDKTYSAATLATALMFGGVVSIFAGPDADLGLLLGLTEDYSLLGGLGAGVLIAFGSNWIYEIFRIVAHVKDWLRYQLPNLNHGLPPF